MPGGPEVYHHTLPGALAQKRTIDMLRGETQKHALIFNSLTTPYRFHSSHFKVSSGKGTFRNPKEILVFGVPHGILFAFGDYGSLLQELN